MALDKGLWRTYAGLRDRQLAREGLVVGEGRIVCQRLMQAGLEVLGLFCLSTAEGDAQAMAKGSCPVECIGPEEMAQLCGYPFHRGIVAIARRPALAGIGRDWANGDWLLGKARSITALWAIADQENLGALARSSLALGMDALLIGPGCADPYGRKALRASMGACLSLPVFYADGEAVEALANAGIRAIAADCSPKALDIRDCPGAKEGRRALFLGNEGYGLGQELLERLPTRVRIPMRPGHDSLNVATAGAILMWELFARDSLGKD